MQNGYQHRVKIETQTHGKVKNYLGQPRAFPKPSKIERRASSLDQKIERRASSLDRASSPRSSPSVEHRALDHEIERRDLDLDLDLGAAWYGQTGLVIGGWTLGSIRKCYPLLGEGVIQCSVRASSVEKNREKSSGEPRSPRSSVERRV